MFRTLLISTLVFVVVLGGSGGGSSKDSKDTTTKGKDKDSEQKSEESNSCDKNNYQKWECQQQKCEWEDTDSSCRTPKQPSRSDKSDSADSNKGKDSKTPDSKQDSKDSKQDSAPNPTAAPSQKPKTKGNDDKSSKNSKDDKDDKDKDSDKDKDDGKGKDNDKKKGKDDKKVLPPLEDWTTGEVFKWAKDVIGADDAKAFRDSNATGKDLVKVARGDLDYLKLISKTIGGWEEKKARKIRDKVQALENKIENGQEEAIKMEQGKLNDAEEQLKLVNKPVGGHMAGASTGKTHDGVAPSPATIPHTLVALGVGLLSLIW